MADITTRQPDRTLTAATLADLLAEFQQPGQPLHGLAREEAERVFIEVVEQLVLKALADRRAVRPN